MPVFFITAGGTSTPHTTTLHSKQTNGNNVFGFNSLQSGPKCHLQSETHSSSSKSVFNSNLKSHFSDLYPHPPEPFSVTRPPKGGCKKRGCCNPLWIFYNKRSIPLCLLPMYPMYSYKSPLSTDTEISTIHLRMTSLSVELGALYLLVIVLLCASSAPWLLIRPQFLCRI